MKVVSIDPTNGREVITNIADPDPSFFSFVNGIELSDEDIRSKIDCMNVSADTKALLYSFSKATIRAGNAILKIGRKIIDIIFTFVRNFPNIAFGVIFGLVVGALVASIPLIGLILGPIATPIAILLGIVLIGRKDWENVDMGERMEPILTQIETILDLFAPLRA